jgi:lysophospholipase L1-like esterase
MGFMTRRSTRSHFRALGLAVLATVIAAAPVGASNGPPPPRPADPGAVYLSLGDSIAFGFQGRILDEQLDSGNLDPSAFHGFTDELTMKLARVHRGTRQVNLGCPGETTASFLHACEYEFGLHQDYTGSSQFAAALATIRSRPGAVGTITITLGANDLTNFLDSCGDDAACVAHGLSRVLSTVRQNLFFIVSALHWAAPRAVVVLFQYYNPFAPFDPSSNANLLALDASIGRVAALTHVKLANAYPRFNLAPPQPQTLCRLTLACDDGDVHPSDAGYHEIANLMFDATGYRSPWRWNQGAATG